MRADRPGPRRRAGASGRGGALVIAAAAAVAAACIAHAATPASTAGTARSASHAVIAYPSGYSRWTHIQSGLIGAGHPAYPRFGGLHHIYANAAALAGYRGGGYPDGSVLVYDLFETRDHGDGIVDQGPRRQIDVMVKDARRFADSGGWGYAEFAAGAATDRLNSAERAGCAACHASRREHGDVFSRWPNRDEPAPAGP